MLFKKHPEELRLTGWWLILLLFLWIGSSSGDWVFKNHVLLISLSCDDYTCHDLKWNHANFIVWLSSVLILSIQVSHMTSCAHCSNAVWWPLGNHRSLSRNIGEWLLAVARLQRGCCTKILLAILACSLHWSCSVLQPTFFNSHNFYFEGKQSPCPVCVTLLTAWLALGE